MSEHLRALVVILALSGIVFVAGKLFIPKYLRGADYNYRCGTWYALTLVAFASPNYWYYAVFTAFYLYFTRYKEKNKTALFLLLLFLVPDGSIAIPGFGIINYLFSINHQRLITLAIFLPIFFKLLNQNDTISFGKLFVDKILICYLVIVVYLELVQSTFTHGIRHACYVFMDILLPYYVFSRSLQTISDFKETIHYYVLAGLLLSIMGVFESLKFWHLYSGLESELGLQSRFTYLDRSGFLRAHVTVSRIPMGYALAIALGLSIFARRFVGPGFIRLGVSILLILGVLSPISRGPWVGAVLIFVLYAFTGKKRLTNLTKVALLGLLGLGVLSMTNSGKELISILPFIGESGQENVSYRQNLFAVSLTVIAENPLFGTLNYLDNPKLEVMRQGQGIIDIVNSYLQIALSYGLVPLGLFVLFFLSILFSTYRKVTRDRSLTIDDRILGQCLFSVLVSALIMIATVSSLSVVPILYWSLAGMSVAYINMKHENHFKELSEVQPDTLSSKNHLVNKPRLRQRRE